ncbi:glycoside hydrolase family 10 protein [soil metagenome]
MKRASALARACSALLLYSCVPAAGPPVREAAPRVPAPAVATRGGVTLLGEEISPAASAAQPASLGSFAAPPPLEREFRGVWVASVSNIDWPSRRGLPAERQKAELLAILDRARDLRLNAVILQVRPAGDALYASSLEPWSEYLTGTMGRAPEPFYDPLAFAVEEAHRRGLELHAWFNPYRARHPSARSASSRDHISRTRPEVVREYGSHLWMDPGERAVQDHSLSVILDVVRRYDIDGVHIDDYFYPYKERDKAGRIIDFPDERSWSRYRAAGGSLSRDDWRRQNVDQFVERLYTEIKREKRSVRFGVSPFGIWRPGYPAQVRGLDAYTELYADARKWLVSGWLDYFAPQLYWPVAQHAQSYPVLLDWWVEQNHHGRHIWPGNFTSRVGPDRARNWPAAELLEQIQLTRHRPGATGNVHFSMRTLMGDPDGLSGQLSAAYREPALVPASPWLGGARPAPPRVTMRTNGEGAVLDIANGPGVAPWLIAIRSRRGSHWTTEILPGRTVSHVLNSRPDAVVVTAIDRLGAESEAFIASAD